MKTLALTTALIVAISAPAFANDSLAASVNAQPGQFSVSELIQLRRAIEDNDTVYEAFIRNGGSETISTQSFGTNSGHDGLAASLGVNPADYSTPQLIQLRRAIEDNDTVYEAFLRNGGSETISTQSFGAPDHVAFAMAHLATPRGEAHE